MLAPLLMRLSQGFMEVRIAEVKTIKDSPKQATNKQAGEGVFESRGLQPDDQGQILFLEPVPWPFCASLFVPLGWRAPTRRVDLKIKE